MSTTTPTTTTRDQLKRKLAASLAGFREGWNHPEDNAVTAMLADYIIGLAGHVAAGRVRFEGQEDGQPTPPQSEVERLRAFMLDIANGLENRSVLTLEQQEEVLDGYVAEIREMVKTPSAEAEECAVLALVSQKIAGLAAVEITRAMVDRFGPEMTMEFASLLRQRDVAIFDAFNQRTRGLREGNCESWRFERTARHMANIYNMDPAEVYRILGMGNPEAWSEAST